MVMININGHFIIFPAMTLAGKLYFDAMSKIGESAAVSPVSRELGKFPCCPVLWLSIYWDKLWKICRLWRLFLLS